MKRFASAWLFLILVCAAPLAHAGEIELLNGDRISGKIKRKDPGRVIVTTAYAGDISIQWDKVKSIRTDGEVRILRGDTGDVIVAQIQPTDEAYAGLRSAEGEPMGAIELAQIAYINPTPDESGEGWVYRGRANVAAAGSRGNSTTDRLYVDSELEGRSKTSRFAVSARGERRTDAGQLASANGLLRANHDRLLANKRFVYKRVSFEHDRFKDIRLRSAIGAGYGVQLYDDETTRLSVQAGLDYVFANFYAEPDTDYPALGWGVKFSRWIFNRRAELFHEQDGYLNLTDARNITLRSASGIRVPLSASLNATAQLNLDWEGKPADDRKPLDSTLLMGIGYVW